LLATIEEALYIRPITTKLMKQANASQEMHLLSAAQAELSSSDPNGKTSAQ